MKKLIRPALILLVSLLAALTVVAFTGTALSDSSPASQSGAAFLFQITDTPPPAEDRSEIGSTDGLTLMSFIIVSIIVIPLFLKRRSWSQT